MIDESQPINLSASAKNDLVTDDYEPDFVIPAIPIPEMLYIPDAFKSPLTVVAGLKGKRRKGNA